MQGDAAARDAELHQLVRIHSAFIPNPNSVRLHEAPLPSPQHLHLHSNYRPGCVLPTCARKVKRLFLEDQEISFFPWDDYASHFQRSINFETPVTGFLGITTGNYVYSFSWYQTNSDSWYNGYHLQPEMELVGTSLAYFGIEERKELLNMYVDAGGSETESIAREALGLPIPTRNK